MSILTSPRDSVATTSSAEKPLEWQASMRRAIRDPVELCRALKLPQKFEIGAAGAARQFQVFVPREFLARMRPGDPLDPLLRQVLPLDDELNAADQFSTDPVGDAEATLCDGLLQKYQSRVLLVVTGRCAVHCRYCFRRHFPYEELPKTADDWSAAIDHIASDVSIDEVILSGGDPLTLGDSRLADLADRLDRIPHLRRLRVHTRLPIMIPSRVTDDLLDWLRATRMTPIVVIHTNHAREIDESVAAAVGRLVDAGIMVLNQSVLLRGVNDSAEALCDLSLRLLDLRVVPYYLHQMDRVAGAAHYEVPIARGRELIEQMRQALPGYAVPKYVQEIAGAPNKVTLA